MAIMIPDVCPLDTSNGEKEIFRRLQKDSSTNDWFVLHSLDIAQHLRQERGEADFIVIVPQKGILCLEVKGASNIRREDGKWFYGSSSKGETRSPFKQASEAMFSIKNRLSERLPSNINPMYYSGVVFPFVEIDSPPDSNEWNEWELIDSAKLTANTFGGLVHNLIDKAKEHHQTVQTMWFNSTSKSPANNLEKLAIKSALRPDFEYFESPSSRLQRSEQEIKQYTEEQFEILDALAANRRVLIEGPAGTGKTLIAIENARRASSEGKSTLLLCYNNTLAAWITTLTESDKNIHVSTLHSLMERYRDPNHRFKNFRRGTYWTDELPEVATLSAMSLDTPPYDCIVIDEAQDLIRENYLMFIDSILKEGLESGTWTMLGDFENQAIYTRDIDHMDILENQASFARVGIRDNCRNTPDICDYVSSITDLDPPYRKTRRQSNNHRPEILYYTNKDEQTDQLISLLQGLTDEAMPSGQTVVLGPTRRGAAYQLLKPGDHKLPYTVHPFNLKGFTQVKKVADGLTIDPPSLDDYIKYSEGFSDNEIKIEFASSLRPAEVHKHVSTLLEDYMDANPEITNVMASSGNTDPAILASVITTLWGDLTEEHQEQLTVSLNNMYGNLLYDLNKDKSSNTQWDIFVPFAWYSTIHSFKGLEAPVVIITDINDLLSEQQKSLLYIAMTRATERLYILADSSQKQIINRILPS